MSIATDEAADQPQFELALPVHELKAGGQRLRFQVMSSQLESR